MTHQELFDRWISAERGVISEYSGDIAWDLKQLHDEAKQYAEENSLELDWNGEWLD
jgi:hypothetical protein